MNGQHGHRMLSASYYRSVDNGAQRQNWMKPSLIQKPKDCVRPLTSGNLLVNTILEDRFHNNQNRIHAWCDHVKEAMTDPAAQKEKDPYRPDNLFEIEVAMAKLRLKD